jgi:hypothetical protein
MTYRFDLHARLEAIHAVNDPLALRAAVRAEIHDPAWLLGRQWQLGEHQGSDAAFPTLVQMAVGETPVTGATNSSDRDPRVTPPEVVIESEPDQWWTIGRRVRVGQAFKQRIPTDRRTELALHDLAAPYDRLNDGKTPDGYAIYQNRSTLNLPDADFHALGVPADEPADDWVPADLAYTATFNAGPATLTVPRHDGGSVDWYSTTATGPNPPAPSPPTTRTSYPTRVNVPGGPNPRWWQIENHRLDPGAVPPARTHLTALLLIRATSARDDGWFTAPLQAPIGTLVAVTSMTVTDSMDLTDTNTPATDWSLFHVSGRRTNEVLLWPTVAHPLTATVPLDVVDIGVDEDANIAWAVEKRVNGAEVVETDPPAAAPPDTPPTGEVAIMRPRRYRYIPATDVPQYWHPYLMQTTGSVRRYNQGRLADLDVRPVVPRPGPTSRLLHDPAATGSAPDHAILPDVIPPLGVRLDRRYMLGRATTGTPLLWIQRRRSPLSGPPTSRLRFDLLEVVEEIT